MQFSSKIENLVESATIAINQHSQQLLRNGEQVHAFGFGQSPFPVPEALRQALIKNAHQKIYLPSLGLPELREAICTYHNQYYGMQFDADCVAVGPGSKMLLYLLLQLLEGHLILPAPAWVSYEPQAVILGKKVSKPQCTFDEGWSIDPEKLDAHLSELPAAEQKILLLNAPNNPSGQLTLELQRLAEVCQKHELLVISDEIYAPLAREYTSLATIIPDQVIVTGGLSKAWGAGGYRLGFAAAPQSMRAVFDKLKILISETYTCASAPIQYAALSVWRDDLEEVNQYIADCTSILQEALALAHKHLTTGGLLCHPSKGGFYLFPEYSPFAESLASNGIVNAKQLSHTLLKQAKVATLPACDFGVVDCLATRMAVTNFDGALALDRQRSQQTLEDVFAPITAGCDAITTWLNSMRA